MEARLTTLIKDGLNRKGMSQADLAQKMDVSDTAVHNWIRFGKATRANKVKLMAILDISRDAMFGEAPLPAVAQPNSPATAESLAQLVEMFQEIWNADPKMHEQAVAAAHKAIVQVLLAHTNKRGH